MSNKRNPMGIVGPALMTAGCVTTAAAGALAAQGEVVGETSVANSGDVTAAGKYDDIARG